MQKSVGLIKVGALMPLLIAIRWVLLSRDHTYNWMPPFWGGVAAGVCGVATRAECALEF